VTPSATFRSGDVVTIRDSRWRVASTVAYGATAVVQAIGCDGANRAERASFLLPFEPCTKVDATRPRVVSPRRWRHVARSFLAQATPFWWSLRAAAAADFDILPYQLEPALAMVRGDANRFLIADAVGLGKTVQASLMIAEIVERQMDAKAIVVCPAGLRDQWCGELSRRFGLRARVIDAASMTRVLRELPPHVNPWSIHTVAVTSIDYIKRPEVIRGLEGLVWDVVVFDEAHNLATHSDRAVAAALIAERARHVVLLTATPHSGDDESFARLCGLGEIGDQDRLLIFRRSRRDMGVHNRSCHRLIRVRPTAAERTMHDAILRYAAQIWKCAAASPGARLAASVLMRRACSSAASLARSVERRLTLISVAHEGVEAQPRLPFDTGAPLDGEPDWQLSFPGLADAADEYRQLESILQLARAAAAEESKVAALRRLLARIAEPVIVFTEYRDTLTRLANELGVFDALQLHGDLTHRDRAEALKQFTNGDSPLLLATDAGSEGLNLHQRCRCVINLELPWMPRRLEQRGGRVDRIGQSRRVHVLSLVAKATCEEDVLARLTMRALRVEQAMDLLSRSPSEERVAAMVLGGEPSTPASESRIALPPYVATASVIGANDEAARIGTARTLKNGFDRLAVDGRPVLTRTRRRPRSGPAGRFWLFTFTCCSPQEHSVWQPVVAIHGCPSCRRSGSAIETRPLLDPSHVELASLVRHHSQRMVDALSEALEGPASRWIRREEAIARRLRERHARLSATLLQPGLFDKRVDRMAGDRHEALQEALSRSSLRIAHLSGLRALRVDGPTLVFGLLLE
jgi:superfamily II DNA or RNA helicase